MSELGLIAESEACTVVAEYEPLPRVAEGWQSEAELEEALVGRLAAQGYEPVRSATRRHWRRICGGNWRR